MTERIMLTVKEAAELMGVSESTMRRSINMGQIPFYRISGVIRIPRENLMRLIDSLQPAAIGK